MPSPDLQKKIGRMLYAVLAVELLVLGVGIWLRQWSTAIVGLGMALLVLCQRWLLKKRGVL